MSAPISFARGAPCPEALNATLVAECTVAALREDGVRLLSYGTGQGYPRCATGSRPGTAWAPIGCS